MTRSYPSVLLLIASLLVIALPCAADSASDQQLLQAVAKDDIGAVRILLANAADIDAKEEHRNTPLIIAAENGNLDIVRLLVEKGASLAAHNTYGETALIEAARNTNPNLVRLLLDANPDAPSKDEALLESARGGPVVLKVADVPGRPQGASQPRSSPEFPWITVTRLLLERGANVEARDKERSTSLIVAAAHGQTEIVLLLLERGANVHARDKYGNTPLIAAACECAVATMNSTYDIVKVLLEKGAQVNARTHEGTTALMNAAGGAGSKAIVEVLLDHGANVTAQDSKGRTALKYAMGANSEDKVQLLKQALAKTRKN